MKVVIDTNVFISGIFWKGDSNIILNYWKANRFTLIISVQIISELIRILSDFKIKLPQEDIKELVDLLVTNSLLLQPTSKTNAVVDDPNDNMFIDVAIDSQADYIISQDKHLLKLKSFDVIKIVTPNEFVRIVNNIK